MLTHHIASAEGLLGPMAFFIAEFLAATALPFCIAAVRWHGMFRLIPLIVPAAFAFLYWRLHEDKVAAGAPEAAGEAVVYGEIFVSISLVAVIAGMLVARGRDRYG